MTLQKYRRATKITVSPSDYQSGMTLIETTIVISILCILVSLAIPLIQNARRNLEANNLFHKISPVLKEARSAAILRHLPVSVCGGSSENCTGRWKDGMLTFIDINQNGIIETPNDHILSYAPLELAYGELTWRGAGGRRHIIYQDNGLPLGSNGSLRYCGQEQKYHRSVVLSMMGNTRRSPDRNLDGIFEDTNGLPLIC
jgi:type IV fimbrial biogenesis protein FimT